MSLLSLMDLPSASTTLEREEFPIHDPNIDKLSIVNFGVLNERNNFYPTSYEIKITNFSEFKNLKLKSDEAAKIAESIPSNGYGVRNLPANIHYIVRKHEKSNFFKGRIERIVLFPGKSNEITLKSYGYKIRQRQKNFKMPDLSFLESEMKKALMVTYDRGYYSEKDRRSLDKLRRVRMDEMGKNWVMLIGEYESSGFEHKTDMNKKIETAIFTFRLDNNDKVVNFIDNASSINKVSF